MNFRLLTLFKPNAAVHSDKELLQVFSTKSLRRVWWSGFIRLQFLPLMRLRQLKTIHGYKASISPQNQSVAVPVYSVLTIHILQQSTLSEAILSLLLKTR